MNLIIRLIGLVCLVGGIFLLFHPSVEKRQAFIDNVANFFSNAMAALLPAPTGQPPPHTPSAKEAGKPRRGVLFAEDSTLPTVEQLGDKGGLRVVFQPIDPANKPTVFTFEAPDPNEKVIPFSELLMFLAGSKSHETRYEIDIHDCKHFSYALYNQAREKNLAVRMVCITLIGEPVGHALAAIKTTDRGIVHVDFTPALDPGSDRQLSQKNLVFVEQGKRYLRVPVADTDPSFGNLETDFITRNTEREEMIARIGSLAKRLEVLDAGIRSLDLRRPSVTNLPDSPQTRRLLAGFNNEVDIVNNERVRVGKEQEDLKKAVAAGEARGWNYGTDEWKTGRILHLPAPFPGRPAGSAKKLPRSPEPAGAIKPAA